MAHPKERIRHVTGDLLVAWGDQADPVARGVKSIQQADVAMAADAEDVGDAFPDQELGDEFGALGVWHVPRLSS
jgi:hypothetical protein